MTKIGWPAVIALVPQVIKLLLEHASEIRRQSLINEGKEIGHAEAVANALQDAIKLVEAGNQARQNVRDSINADPGSLRDNDGFKRQ